MSICAGDRSEPRSATLPTLRANLGVGFVPSIFGVEQEIYADKMPWPQRHLSKEEISDLNPADFKDGVA